MRVEGLGHKYRVDGLRLRDIFFKVECPRLRV
jgi:hypothetical protein